MTEREIISWIFLSTVLASQKEAVNMNSISMIADGINHSIPTEKEMRIALSWLTQEGLLLKQGSKYSLTHRGVMKYQKATESTSLVLEIWKNLIGELFENDFK